MPRVWLAVFFCIASNHCAQAVLVGSTAGGWAERPQNRISPQQALEMARPHLPFCWELRCRYVHRGNKHWCSKPPRDFVVEKGRYYYVTRTSYPYKTLEAYVFYAVRIHTRTGELELPEAPE